MVENFKDQNQLPWIEEYRPKKINDVIDHIDIIRILKKFIESKNLPNLLFYGSPGTGKTSTILALAKEMYTTSYDSMVLEKNASNDRGIFFIRSDIKNFASTKIIDSKFKYKLIILDEVDAMTIEAQTALRFIMDEYFDNVRFCLICNYVSKLIYNIQSRCMKFRFKIIGFDYNTTNTTT